MQQLALDGLYTGGSLPYGYRAVPSGIRNVIAHYLNDHGYKTANGSKSTSMAITRMLSTPLARGYTKEGQTSEALQRLKIISEEEAARIDEILEHRARVNEEKRRIATKTKGGAMLSDNIFCAHCGGRITTMHHKDHYFRKDGSEYLKDTLKYCCYYKSRKLCECDGQTNFLCFPSPHPTPLNYQQIPAEKAI